MSMIKPILLTMTQVSAFAEDTWLTPASGLFFLRDDRKVPGEQSARVCVH